MSTFEELLREHGDVDGVAVALRLNARQREALEPLMVEKASNIQRNIVNRLERTVFAGKKVDLTELRAALVAQTFTLPDGRRVCWGEATVEDHAERIVMLVKLRDGIDRTIGRHQRAIEAITEQGVSCLNEIAVAA